MLPPERPRRPADVPDCIGPDVTAGLDSDADGTPDSVFTDDGEDLLLHTDLDADGYGDQVLRLRPDASTSVEQTTCDDPPSPGPASTAGGLAPASTAGGLAPASTAGGLVDALTRWWRG